MIHRFLFDGRRQLQMTFCYLLVLTFAVSNKSFSQSTGNFIKTTEYYSNKQKRRDLFMDNDLKVKKEYYYEKDDQGNDYIILAVEYFTDTTLKKVTVYNSNGSARLIVDFKSGVYNDYVNNVYLKFKGNFLFDGIQKGEKIIVNYLNGKRNGRLIQTDSAINGKKIVITQAVDPRYLRFDIIKFYNQPIEVSTYKLFNGIELNFENGELNGIQKAFYSTSQIKFQAEYNNFRLCGFNSYANDGTIVSRIKTSNGYTNSNQIINGSVNADSKYRLYYLRQIGRVGKIVVPKEIDDVGDIILEDYQNDQERLLFNNKLKSQFDTNKRHFNINEDKNDEESTLTALFGIPHFEIFKYDLETSDDNLIDPVYFNEPKDTTKLELLNSLEFYHYFKAWEGGSDDYYFPLPNHRGENGSDLTNFQYGVEKISIENGILEDYLSTAFGLDVGKIIGSTEATKSCLVDVDWLFHRDNLNALWRFHSDGNCEYENVLPGYQNGASGKGTWVIEKPGKVVVSTRELSPFRRMELTLVNCRALEFYSETFRKK